MLPSCSVLQSEGRHVGWARRCDCIREVSRCRGIAGRGTPRKLVVKAHSERDAPMTCRVLSALTALSLLAGAPTAHAELVQTVPASQIQQYAREINKQPVNKGKLWGVIVGGAASLFLLTVAVENYEGWFPAIARANKFMAMNKRKMQAEEARAKAEREAIDLEAQETRRQTALVEDALKDKGSRVLGKTAAPAATGTSASPQDDVNLGNGPSSRAVETSHQDTPAEGESSPSSTRMADPSQISSVGGNYVVVSDAVSSEPVSTAIESSSVPSEQPLDASQLTDDMLETRALLQEYKRRLAAKKDS